MTQATCHIFPNLKKKKKIPSLLSQQNVSLEILPLADRTSKLAMVYVSARIRLLLVGPAGEGAEETENLKNEKWPGK